jgi:hypothetical protein
MDLTDNITIPKKYRKDFTPEERVLFNQYVGKFMKEYCKRDEVKAHKLAYQREYRARKKLEKEQLKAVC